MKSFFSKNSDFSRLIESDKQEEHISTNRVLDHNKITLSSEARKEKEQTLIDIEDARENNRPPTLNERLEIAKNMAAKVLNPDGLGQSSTFQNDDDMSIRSNPLDNNKGEVENFTIPDNIQRRKETYKKLKKDIEYSFKQGLDQRTATRNYELFKEYKALRKNKNNPSESHSDTRMPYKYSDGYIGELHSLHQKMLQDINIYDSIVTGSSPILSDFFKSSHFYKSVEQDLQNLPDTGFGHADETREDLLKMFNEIRGKMQKTAWKQMGIGYAIGYGTLLSAGLLIPATKKWPLKKSENIERTRRLYGHLIKDLKRKIVRFNALERDSNQDKEELL